jgi:hypothetical protein
MSRKRKGEEQKLIFEFLLVGGEWRELFISSPQSVYRGNDRALVTGNGTTRAVQ